MKIKKLVATGALAMLTLSLTGCKNLPIHSDTAVELRTRIAQNMKYIDTLTTNGFVSQEQGALLKKSMDDMGKTLSVLLSVESDDSSGAIEGVESPDGTVATVGGDSKVDAGKFDTFQKQLESAVVASYEGPTLATYLKASTGESPIGFSKTDVKNVNDLAGLELWVLKGTTPQEVEEIISGTAPSQGTRAVENEDSGEYEGEVSENNSSGNELVKLDEIQNRINTYLASKRTEEDFKPLTDYFEPAKMVSKDASGKEVVTDKHVLLDLPDVITATASNSVETNVDCKKFNSDNPRKEYFGDINIGNNEFNKDFLIYGVEEIVTNFDVITKDANGAEVKTATPGKENMKSVAGAIRLMEINEEFIEAVTGLDSSGDSIYIVHRGNSTNTSGTSNQSSGAKILLIQYPVSYIKNIEVDKTEGVPKNTYKAVIEPSDKLYINLKTSKLKMKKAGTDSSGSAVSNFTDVVQNKSDYYLTDKSSLDNAASMQSANIESDPTKNGASFTLGSSCFLNAELKLRTSGGSEKVKRFSSGSIVLRDYTELVYMPDVVPNEKWVATGRKIRFSKLSGQPDTRWGYYVDNAGEAFKSGYMVDVQLKDIISNESPDVKTFNRIPVNKDDIGTDTSETSGEVQVADDRLPDKYVGKINACIPYPNSTLASTAVNGASADRPLLFGVKVDMNMFDSKLFTNWIDSDDYNNSLTWWNEWLAENGFDYKISLDSAHDFFTGNYGYEHIVQGDIVFNMDTIKKLQSDINNAKAQGNAALIRTLFIGLGLLSMFYGLLLIAAWTFDINIPFGPRLLTIFTLGLWIAVKDAEDEDNIGEDKKFMTFKSVLIHGLIVSGAGLALIVVDPVELIVKLLTAASSITKALQMFK